MYCIMQFISSKLYSIILYENLKVNQLKYLKYKSDVNIRLDQPKKILNNSKISFLNLKINLKEMLSSFSTS